MIFGINKQSRMGIITERQRKRAGSQSVYIKMPYQNGALELIILISFSRLFYVYLKTCNLTAVAIIFTEFINCGSGFV